MRPTAILETCLYVDNLSSAEAFYRQVLGLHCVGRDPARHVFFRCGQQMLLLFLPEVSSSEKSDVPQHGSHGPGHIAFQIESDHLASWQEQLVKHGITVEQMVQWPHGGESLYFRDPAGNSLELVSTAVWGLNAPASERKLGNSDRSNSGRRDCQNDSGNT